MLEKTGLLYEGKAKRVYRTPEPDLLILEYKDDATAFDGLKREQIPHKGRINNAIAAIFFELLAKNGISSHYVKKLSDREMLVRALEIIPVEIIVRNIAAGSLAKRLGLSEGAGLSRPILEHNLKNDELHDPMINRYHIMAMDLATAAEIEVMERTAFQVNRILQDYLKPKGIVLVDFKLEFGRSKGEIMLGDEITPDTCRFWDSSTGEKMDKDRFRRDLGGVIEAYREILDRLEGGSLDESEG